MTPQGKAGMGFDIRVCGKSFSSVYKIMCIYIVALFNIGNSIKDFSFEILF